MAKKARERTFLEMLRKGYGGFPVGEVSECECPDFIVGEGKDAIGIEITERFWEQPRFGLPVQAKESNRSLICRRVEKALMQAGVKSIWISIHFNNSASLTKASVGPLSDRIVEVVSKFMPAIGECYDIDANHYWEALPGEVDEIHMHRSSESDIVAAMTPVAHWIPSLGPEQIEKAVRQKEDRLGLYHERVNTVWLLIVLEGGSVANWFGSSDEALRYTYTTAFDRLLLLWANNGLVRELKVMHMK